MTAYIDRIHAAPAPTAGPVPRLPQKLDAPALVEFLRRLGLMVPTKLAAAASTGNLRASGHQYALKEVNSALAKANLPFEERMVLKAAMGQHGILPK